MTVNSRPARVTEEFWFSLGLVYIEDLAKGFVSCPYDPMVYGLLGLYYK